MPGAGLVPAHVLPPYPQVGAGEEGVRRRGPDARDSHCARMVAQAAPATPRLPVPAQSADVQDDVQDRRTLPERTAAAPSLPTARSRAGIIVVQEGAADTEKDDDQVFAHQIPRLLPEPEAAPGSGSGQDKDAHIQHQGGERAIMQKESAIPPAAYGFAPPAARSEMENDHAAAHGQAQQNGGQKGHQCEGGAHRRQSVGSQQPPYNQCVGNVVAAAAADFPASWAGQTAAAWW